MAKTLKGGKARDPRPAPLSRSPDVERVLLEGLFEFAPDAILVADAEGRIARVNSQVEKMFGYARGELVGEPVETLVPDRHRATHVAHRDGYARAPHVRRMGEGLDLRGRRKDGAEFPIEVALGPFSTESGQIVLAIVRDVTERKQIEEKLRRAHDELGLRVEERTAELQKANRRILEEQAKVIQSEKLSSIGRLAAGVAHEINNPLSGVMGLVKALEREGLAEPKRREYLDTIREGLERMQLTVRGLLDYSRQRKPSTSRIDVAQVVASCLRLMGPALRQGGANVEVGIEEGTAHVRADEQQLMQALLNVLMNAAHATSGGGRIRVSAHRDGDRVGIRVADTGGGIPREILERVTDPFFTTKPEGQGTGLGLAITLGIVQAHGGDLAIESEPGRGTEVTLWLPSST